MCGWHDGKHSLTPVLFIKSVSSHYGHQRTSAEISRRLRTFCHTNLKLFQRRRLVKIRSQFRVGQQCFWTANMDNLDVPPNYVPPPPPKRPVRPKITLQIPDTVVQMTPRGATTGSSMYRGPPRFVSMPPGTPGSHISDPHTNPYLMHLYHNKASDFMFKQFEGFKDFTMNTAKSGLSAGEKSAFWFYNKLKLLSRRWFTHLFLSLLLCLYSVVGATVFVALEGKSCFDYLAIIAIICSHLNTQSGYLILILIF